MSIEMIEGTAVFPAGSFSWVSQVDQKIEEISKIFYDHVIYPIGVGVSVGVADFAVTASVFSAFSALGLVEFVEEVGGEILDPTEAAISAMLDSSWFENFIGPCIEEVIFRVVIQGSIRWIAAKILPDQEVDLLGYIKLPLPALVSIVATSVLFGMLHYQDGGFALVVVSTLGGLGFGILKEKIGFISGLAAHVTTNSLLDVAEAVLG